MIHTLFMIRQILIETIAARIPKLVPLDRIGLHHAAWAHTPASVIDSVEVRDAIVMRSVITK